MPTKIAWTDESWNPVTGCTPVSEGCAHCYAARTSKRFGRDFRKVTLHPDRLDIPLHWRKPRMVFVPSMGDLFHPDVPEEFIDRVFATMAICGAERQTCKWAGCDHDDRSGCWTDGEGRSNPRLTFQVLTKRPERMLNYLRHPDRQLKIEAVGNDPEWSIQWEPVWDMIDGAGWPLPNVWLGVSVENQARADERIPLLLDTPAAVRFVSAEPLLGPLDLTDLPAQDEVRPHFDALRGVQWRHDGVSRIWDRLGLPSLDWVIVGGESGGPPERRLVERNTDAAGVDANQAPRHLPVLWDPKPEALQWVRDICDQCQTAGVPFFFKQWGPRAGQGTLLDGREHRETPEVRA